MPAETLSAAVQKAPQRRNTSLCSLSFSLAAPPLAWSAQSLAGYAISSEACFPGDVPRTTPLFAAMWQVLLLLNIVALAIALLAGLLAYRNWCAAHQEGGEDTAQLMERGEGRTRFLAMCGMLSSSGFLVAIVFTTVILFLSPLCR